MKISVHESIITNPKVKGKPMSFNQLDAIFKIVAKYDVRVDELGSCMTVVQASDLIKKLYDAKNSGKLKLREKPFPFHILLQAFMDKYPNAYTQIIMRDV
jgi:hypothetical protein